MANTPISFEHEIDIDAVEAEIRECSEAIITQNRRKKELRGEAETYWKAYQQHIIDHPSKEGSPQGVGAV